MIEKLPDSIVLHVSPKGEFTWNENADEMIENGDFSASPATQYILRTLRKTGQLHQCCRDIYEVWAGSEGIPEPQTAAEAYLLSLVEQMRDIAKEGLK